MLYIYKSQYFNIQHKLPGGDKRKIGSVINKIQFDNVIELYFVFSLVSVKKNTILYTHLTRDTIHHTVTNKLQIKAKQDRTT